MRSKEQRTSSANTALSAYVNEVGDNGDEQDNLTDLLADLLHLADSWGLDFETSMRRAKLHYGAEA